MNKSPFCRGADETDFCFGGELHSQIIGFLAKGGEKVDRTLGVFP